MAENTVKTYVKEHIHEDQILFGFIMVVLFLVGLTLQTATTEAYGQPIADVTVWNLFVSTISQLPSLFTGSLLVSELPRVLLGWGVEALYYLCITGHRRMKKAVEHHHPWAIVGLDALAIACVGFCGLTDWVYANQLIRNGWWALALTIIISSLVMYCGPIGIYNIKSGFGLVKG
jgi:hypothetical protein